MATLIIIGFLLLAVNFYITNRRIITVNKLHTLYDKLELEFIKQDIEFNDDLRDFLRNHKMLAKNNHLLDIFFLFRQLKHIEEDKSYVESKKRYNEYVSKFPESVKLIMKEINLSQDTVINISIFKPINLLFMATILSIAILLAIPYYIFKAFGLIFSKLNEIPSLLKELYQSENVIVSHIERNKFA